MDSLVFLVKIFNGLFNKLGGTLIFIMICGATGIIIFIPGIMEWIEIPNTYNMYIKIIFVIGVIFLICKLVIFLCSKIKKYLRTKEVEKDINKCMRQLNHEEKLIFSNFFDENGCIKKIISLDYLNLTVQSLCCRKLIIPMETTIRQTLNRNFDPEMLINYKLNLPTEKYLKKYPTEFLNLRNK